MRLSFTGDILCYASQDAACRQSDGTYVYYPIFEQVKFLFKDSDYVVGSLETTLSGLDAVYTHSPISFNTPDSFAKTLKDVGFDMLTTANNHCWDRGEKGLKRTLSILDEAGIEHTGTRLTKQEENYMIKDFKGTKVAFLSYTYGTNYSDEGKPIPAEKEYLVNFTRQPDRQRERPLYRRILGRLFRLICPPKAYIGTVLDCVSESEISTYRNVQYETAMISTIQQVKSEADIVIMCLHSGGQFNSKVGSYTQHLFDIIADAGVDVIVTNHAHTILPLYKKDNCWIASALGNFSFAPGEGYYVDGVYADYSAVLHVDVDEKSITEVSYTLCKCEKNNNGLGITTIAEPNDEVEKRLKNTNQI